MLSDEKLAGIKQGLRKRQADVQAEIRAELAITEHAHYCDLLDKVHDAGEESVADLLSDLNYASIDRHVVELRDIEAAFTRISTGSFGICADCGDPIGEPRLMAYPTAKRCYACQHRHEQVSGKRPSL